MYSMQPLVSFPQGPSLPQMPQPTDTSPFKPASNQISTMRPTVASQLSEALDEVDTKELEGTFDNIAAAAANDTEVSFLNPDQRSSLSVEEAQKSLSSEDSGDSFAIQDSRLDKSVSFAARHQVVSVLATPQVPAGGGRFVVADGNTKEKDGEAGVHSVRRLSPVPPIENESDQAAVKEGVDSNELQDGPKVESGNDLERSE